MIITPNTKKLRILNPNLPKPKSNPNDQRRQIIRRKTELNTKQPIPAASNRNSNCRTEIKKQQSGTSAPGKPQTDWIDNKKTEKTQLINIKNGRKKISEIKSKTVVLGVRLAGGQEAEGCLTGHRREEISNSGWVL